MSAAASGLNKRFLLPIGILAVIAGLAVSIPVKGLSGTLQSHNLFALIGNLGGTTGSMLRNTQALHKKVQYVEGELGQLNTEESILQQQMVTGSQLSQQLVRQETLTRTDVQLMQQILIRQGQSVNLTGQVATQASQLSTSVQQNVQQLTQLGGSLNTANQESATLNQQMSQLLYELDQATQEFRLFGQVNQLLSGAGALLGSGASSKSGGSSLLGSLPLTGLNSSAKTAGTGSKSNLHGSSTNPGSGLLSSNGTLGSLLGALP